MLHTKLRDMNDLPPLPDGRIYLAVGPHCWGKDASPKKAIAKCKSNFPSFTGKWKFLLYDAPVDTWINDYGQAETHTEEKATLIGYWNTTAAESPAVAQALVREVMA